jgi:hypothetical protein
MGQSQMGIKIRRIISNYSTFKSRRDKIFVELNTALMFTSPVGTKYY